MKQNPLPSIEYLSSRFFYLDGELYEKESGKALPKVLRKNGYFISSVKGKYYMHHRLVYAVCNEVNVFDDIDHINCNRKENRIENLRIATQAQNTRNRKIHKNNAIGVKGIRFIHGKYQARLMFQGVTKSKLHGTLDDAEKWIKKQRKLLHGAFARNS